VSIKVISKVLKNDHFRVCDDSAVILIEAGYCHPSVQASFPRCHCCAPPSLMVREEL